MSQATPKIREFAKRLLAHETEGSSAEGKRGAFSVCGRMRPQLANLMGSVGFRVLLSRALGLASEEAGWLREVRVKVDGTLEDSDASSGPADSAEREAGEVALISQLLGLLVTFIGENLTVRLVHGVWPQLSLNDLKFGNGDKNGKK